MMKQRTPRSVGFAMAVLALGAGPIVGCKSTNNDGRPHSPEPVMVEDERPPQGERSNPQDGSVQPSQTPAAPVADAPLAPPAPHQLDPETDPDEVEGWRPAWWLEDPMKTPQHGLACAYATDPELSKARTLAVDYARQRLTQLLGHEPRATEMKTDALKLPSGEYRAFVLIQTPLK